MRPVVGYPEFGIPPLCSMVALQKEDITIADIQVWFNATDEMIYRQQRAAQNEARH